MGEIVEQNGFGWRCLSNDSENFAICVKKAISSDLNKMGALGRMYLENNYNVKNGYEIIMKHFNEQ